MFSILRNRFGIPGIISVIALIFAMTGGAFAANHYLAGAGTSKAKHGRPGPRGPRGKTGATGATGPAGLAGTNGTAGLTGSKGAPGEDGTFSTEPLPEGQSLSGVWSELLGAHSSASVSISYPIQVVPAPTVVVYIRPDGESALYFNPVDGEVTAFVEGEPEVIEEDCPGSPANPKAVPSRVCVYVEEEEKAGLNGFGLFGEPNLGTSPDPESGAIFPVEDSTAEPGYVKGSWVVTAS